MGLGRRRRSTCLPPKQRLSSLSILPLLSMSLARGTCLTRHFVRSLGSRALLNASIRAEGRVSRVAIVSNQYDCWGNGHSKFSNLSPWLSRQQNDITTIFQPLGRPPKVHYMSNLPPMIHMRIRLDSETDLHLKPCLSMLAFSYINPSVSRHFQTRNSSLCPE